MLPAALEYPLVDYNGLHVYRPARGGRLCEQFGVYKTINRIPLLCQLNEPVSRSFTEKVENVWVEESGASEGATVMVHTGAWW